MLRYKDFEQEIRAIAEDDFMRWVYLLPAVPVHLRKRFLTTVELGIEIPDAFDYVMTSQTIHEEEYLLFLQQAVTSKDEA